MSEKNLQPVERDTMLGELAKKETEFIRFRRLRLTHNEFENIRLIGRGAFGEVRTNIVALGEEERGGKMLARVRAHLIIHFPPSFPLLSPSKLLAVQYMLTTIVFSFMIRNQPHSDPEKMTNTFKPALLDFETLVTGSAGENEGHW